MTQGKDTVFHPGVDMNLPGNSRTNPINTDRLQWDDGIPDDVNPEQGEGQREAGSSVEAAADIEYYDISGFSSEPVPQGAPEQRTSIDGRGPATTGRLFAREQSDAARYDAANLVSGRDDSGNANAIGGVLAGGDGPVAGGDPVEVVTLEGTQWNDVLMATQAAAPAGFQGEVYAKGGDDMIIRDRTGGYDAEGGSFLNASIDGGSGFDIINYASLVTGVNVALDPILPASSGTAVQQSGGFPFGTDVLHSIEGVFGTTHDDNIHGDDNANKLWGHDGDDVLEGYGGNDSLWGGIGNDTINGGSGNDYIEGNDNNDHITGGTGSDTIDGGDGNDGIWGGIHADVLHGGSGNDTVFGGSGNDEIHDGDGSDDVHGNSGNDTFFVGDGSDTLAGGSGNDEFHVSGFGDNVINGGIGNDTVIFGNAGVIVNLGIDWANRGVEGIDTITGVENITTGTGADVLAGTDGNNVINSGGGHDLASGLEGHDTMYGGSGEDTLWGNQGNDDLIGGSGNDELWGQEGVDEIYGESGNDTLNGGADSDQISGGADEDRIRGGSGEDWMIGGADADTFVWNAGDVDVPVIDQILDFDVNEDLFSFGAGFFDAGPGPFNLSSVLVAAPHAGGDSLLWADTDTVAGWQVIARLKNVSATDLNEKIQNGSILDVETVFEGPGEFVPVHDDGGMFGIGFGADFIM